jgi:hypothetical protein
MFAGLMTWRTIGTPLVRTLRKPFVPIMQQKMFLS